MQAAAALRRALLVEDEVLVAMYVEDALSELGYAVTAVASNLAEALALAREDQFDFAVLDINLNGEKSFPVAELLRKRQIPFPVRERVYLRRACRGVSKRSPAAQAVPLVRPREGDCAAVGLASIPLKPPETSARTTRILRRGAHRGVGTHPRPWTCT
jgi:CheY-like chemotaxis protein